MSTQSSVIPGSNSVSGAASRAHHIVDDMAEKAVPAVQTASDVAHKTIDKMATASMSAADWVASNSNKVKNNSAAMAEACSGQIRARPLISVAGALLLGYFVGRMLR